MSLYCPAVLCCAVRRLHLADQCACLVSELLPWTINPQPRDWSIHSLNAVVYQSIFSYLSIIHLSSFTDAESCFVTVGCCLSSPQSRSVVPLYLGLQPWTHTHTHTHTHTNRHNTCIHSTLEIHWTHTMHIYSYLSVPLGHPCPAFDDSTAGFLVTVDMQTWCFIAILLFLNLACHHVSRVLYLLFSPSALCWLYLY